MKANPSNIQSTPTSVQILLPLFLDTNGDIHSYAIIVSRVGYAEKRAQSRLNSENGFELNMSSWKNSEENDFQLPYQVTVPGWTPSGECYFCYNWWK